MSRFAVSRTLLGLGLAAALCAPAAVQPKPAAPVPAAPAATDKLFAIILSPGPKWKPGRPFAEQGLRDHFFYWKALFDAGRVASAGPMGSDHGLVLLRASDQAAADAVVATDPAVKAGVFVGVARAYAPGMVRDGVLIVPAKKMTVEAVNSERPSGILLHMLVSFRRQ